MSLTKNKREAWQSEYSTFVNHDPRHMASQNHKPFQTAAQDYLKLLSQSFDETILAIVHDLANDLLGAWQEKRKVFICGNGGSAANAIHIANDLHYGVGVCGRLEPVNGIRVEALPANPAIISCLANDTGYENIFSHQIGLKGDKDDLLIILSGSGNSRNIVNALKAAKITGLKSYAIVAFDGGECKKLADKCIHIQVNDMQIAEDTQLIIGHLCMQWLSNNRKSIKT